ncbi:hypothetical protein [Sorangium sp. So ce341]|uniref:hypothetical protein n=1 Tax=Sorangium sp. So ce341 TaxID=3133302 RepID=UPI003F6439A4
MLDEHGEEFDERNAFLHLALGLVSASRRLDAVLARHGRRPSSSPGVPRLPEPGDERLLDFLLGLISFRESVHRALRAAKRAPRAAPGPTPRATLRGLLR